ncbi:hypothetical protein ACYCMK_25195, partial [Klebsiella pneumoniae]
LWFLGGGLFKFSSARGATNPLLCVANPGFGGGRFSGFNPWFWMGGDVCIGLFWSTRSDVKMVYRFTSVGFF